MKISEKIPGKLNERVVALLLVLATVGYLLATSAIAQSSVTSDNGAKVAYDPDYLSYGDMYAFTETTYENSNYGLKNAQQTVSLHNSKAANTNSASNFTFYQYYGSVTTGNHSNVTDGAEMKNHDYTDYHNGYEKAAAPAAVEGETVPVLTTTGTGVYTLVPGSTGSYRIYVYSETDPSGSVHYELIDSYIKANAYTGAPTQSLNFTRVADTNYWYASINVNTLSWSAYRLTAAKSTSNATSAADDTNGATTYTGSQKTNTTLNNDTYYYNVWTATEILYDTLLSIRWDSGVSLGPVTRQGDTITIDNTDTSMGSLSAINVFGESIAAGSAVSTPHAPIYITATPASDEYVFSGFGSAELSLVDAKQGIYKYGFESTATLTGSWLEKEALPTVKISGSYTGSMDFFAASSATTQIVSGTQGSYTLTVDYTDAKDTQSVAYTVTSAGATIDSGTIAEDSNTIQVSAQWDAVIVSITATSVKGTSYTAKFTVNVSNAGLVDVAQIGTTKYQYIEDALAAATSGQTITIISSKVSFVASDTVPAAWTADANGDGAPDGYTVKSGVKLVIPYSNTGLTTPKGSSDDYPYALYDGIQSGSVSLATSPDYEYRKLTLPAGKTMYVLGQVNTGGTLCGTGVAGSTSGSTTNTYSVLEINGDMEVQNGGIVSSCGYIYGGGTLYARSGSKLYQPLVICDFRGGGYTVGAAGKSYAIKNMPSGETFVSPFLRYTTQNIQATVRMNEGALMYGYSDLYANDSHNRTTGVVVGSSTTNGLIKLNTGATLTAAYDKDDVVGSYPYVGRIDITIDGGAGFGTLSLTTQGQTITTDELSFPIPYNYAFHLNGAGSTYTIAYSMVLLPGATMEVGEGATLDVGNDSSDFRFMVMDGFNDHTSSGKRDENMTVTYGQKPGSNYPTTADLQAAGKSGTADLIVNGTLNINNGVNFGGVVQAGSADAKLVMDDGATPSCSVQAGLVGDMSMLIYHYYFAGATVRTLDAQVVDRGTGERTNIVAGKTYYGAEGSDIISDYTYKLYTDSASKTASESHTEALNATVQGSWYTYDATIHMVDNSGNILSTQTTYFCHGADVSDYYLDAACTQPASIVTEDHMVLYSNDIAARVEWSDGTAASYYPNLRNAVKDAVNAGDQVVLMKDITLDKSVPIDASQSIGISLGDNGTPHTISYTSTPFVNSGSLTLDVGGGTITNNVGGSYASGSAVINNADASASIDLNGGSILVQAPEGQATQFNAVVNYGTLSVADTAGNGGIYCYGPLGAEESGWKDITLTTNLGGTPTATVKAEIYADTLATEVTYTGIYNTGTIAEISGGVIRSPMYGVYNGSAGDVTYPQSGLASLARANSVITTTAQIEKISGGVIQGGWVGLMNNGASIGEITGGTVQSTGTLFAANGDVIYSALYNGFGTVGNVSNASFLSNDAFTLTRYRFTFNDDGSQGSNTATGTNSSYGIYNYGYTTADTTVSAGYSYFVSALGDLTNCTIEAMGTELTEGLLSSSYTGTYTGTVNNDNARALMNYGAVGNITGGSIAGNWGISNHNLVYTHDEYDNGNSSTYTKYTATRTVVSESVIGDIRDCDVSAYYHYALYNCGKVGSLCGNSTFTAYAKATSGNAVYNNSGWYNGTASYQQITEREAYTNASGATAYRNTRITYNYDESATATGLDDAAAVWKSIPLPTIDSITDNVTITTVNKGTSAGWGYALNNAGRINSIGGGTGTVTIQTYTGDGATASTSNYGLQNSAYIGSIGDNVTISASGERALQNSGNRLSRQVNTYTYDYDKNSATVTTTDIVYDYCAPAYIGSIGSATISAGTQYGILNYGWVGSLTGSTVTTGTGAYGVVNQADSSASWYHTLTYTTAAAAPVGYDPANPGYLEEYTRFGAKIGTIANASITSGTSNALLNNGEIGAITGNTVLTSTTNYALNNDGSHQTGHVLKRYNLGQTDTINTARYITLEEKTYHTYAEGGSYIGEIGEGVTIQAKTSNGLYNAGTIGSITGASISTGTTNAITQGAAYQERSTFRYLYGTAPMGTSTYIGETNLSYTKAQASIGTISGVTATSGSNYALNNQGAIGTIENSSINATTYGALLNNGSLSVGYTLNLPEGAGNSPAYLEWVELNAAGNGYVFRVFDVTEQYDWGKIDSIADTDITAKTHSTSNQNALYNAGEIGSISGGSITCEWTGNQSYYTVYNSGNLLQSRRQVMSDITDSVADIAGGNYVTQYVRTYTNPETGTIAPTIGNISNVTLSNSYGYGVYNAGIINSISGGSVTARAYGINNADGYYTGTRKAVQVYRGAARLTTTAQYFNETSVGYTREQPVITAIDGVTVDIIGANYGISNGGIIGSIVNSDISTATERAISNTGTTAVSYTNDYDNGIGGDVAAQFTLTSGTAGSVPSTDTTYKYKPARIELIGGGNTIAGTTNVVINSGEIAAIDNTDAEGNVLADSTITASTGVALYNFEGLNADRVRVNNTDTTTYTSAHIGTVKNVILNGHTYAILNGTTNGTYKKVAIEELGEGVEATSAAGHALYNQTYSRIGSGTADGEAAAYSGGITGGIYTAVKSGSYYGVYNNSTIHPIYISAGDFKGGNNSDSTLGRAYAIFQPDTETRQIYPEGLSLSPKGITESVTFADGTTSDGYYFIGTGYTVKFHQIGEDGSWDTATENIVLKNGETVGSVNLPELNRPEERDGYTTAFRGWCTLDNGEYTVVAAEESGALEVTGDMDLYAVFDTEANIYTVTLKTGAGALAESDLLDEGLWTKSEEGVYTLEYTVESETVQLPGALHDVFTFLGWVYEEAGDVKVPEGTAEGVMETVTIPSGTIGNLTYTAAYSGPEVNYYLDELSMLPLVTDGETEGIFIVPSDDTFTALGNDAFTVPEGRSLDGWRDADGNLYAAGETYTRTDNLALYANWKNNEYTVTLYTNAESAGGSAEITDAAGVPVENGMTQVYTYGQVLENLPKLRAAGYVFGGWTDADGNIVSSETLMNASDLALTAVWAEQPEGIPLISAQDKTMPYGTVGTMLEIELDGDSEYEYQWYMMDGDISAAALDSEEEGGGEETSDPAEEDGAPAEADGENGPEAENGPETDGENGSEAENPENDSQGEDLSESAETEDISADEVPEDSSADEVENSGETDQGAAEEIYVIEKETFETASAEAAADEAEDSFVETNTEAAEGEGSEEGLTEGETSGDKETEAEGAEDETVSDGTEETEENASEEEGAEAEENPEEILEESTEESVNAEAAPASYETLTGTLLDGKTASSYEVPSDTQVGVYRYFCRVTDKTTGSTADIPVILTVTPLKVTAATASVPETQKYNTVLGTIDMTILVTGFTGQDGNEVIPEGAFAWETADTALYQTGYYHLIFTPSDKVNYDYSALPGWNSETGTLTIAAGVKVQSVYTVYAAYAADAETTDAEGNAVSYYILTDTEGNELTAAAVAGYRSYVFSADGEIRAAVAESESSARTMLGLDDTAELLADSDEVYAALIPEGDGGSFALKAGSGFESLMDYTGLTETEWLSGDDGTLSAGGEDITYNGSSLTFTAADTLSSDIWLTLAGITDSRDEYSVTADGTTTEYTDFHEALTAANSTSGAVMTVPAGRSISGDVNVNRNTVLVIESGAIAAQNTSVVLMGTAELKTGNGISLEPVGSITTGSSGAYTTYTAEPQMEIKAATLTIGDQVSINYAISSTDAAPKGVAYSSEKNALLAALHLGSLSDVTAYEKVSDSVSLTDYTVLKTKGVKPTQMGQTLYTTAYSGTENAYAYSQTAGYSVSQYAKSMLANENSSDSLKQLLSAMLRYGAASERHFDASKTTAQATDGLADLMTGVGNTDLSSDPNMPTQEDGSEYATSLGDADLEIALALDESVNFAIRNAGGGTDGITDVRIELYDPNDGRYVELDADLKDGVWIGGAVPPRNYDNWYRITVTKSGTEYTAVYSVFSYLNEASDLLGTDLIHAMAEYCHAAEDYQKAYDTAY